MKFMFDTDWMESLRDCSAEVRLEVYEAVIRYAASGTLSDLKPMAKMAFNFIKVQIDSFKESEIKANNLKAMAGIKGAEARWNNGNNGNNGIAIREEKEEVKEKGTQKEIQEQKEEKEKDIDKSISKKKDDRVRFVESLPEDWRQVMITWLKYKSERRESYKSAQSMKVFFKHLQEYSNHDVTEAERIIEQSIANNWAGAFPIKDKSYTPKSNSKFVDLPTDYTRPQPGFHI